MAPARGLPSLLFAFHPKQTSIPSSSFCITQLLGLFLSWVKKQRKMHLKLRNIKNYLVWTQCTDGFWTILIFSHYFCNPQFGSQHYTVNRGLLRSNRMKCNIKKNGEKILFLWRILYWKYTKICKHNTLMCK